MTSAFHPIAVTVTGVHQEEQPPFYNIRFDGGGERQTVRQRLVPCNSLIAPTLTANFAASESAASSSASGSASSQPVTPPASPAATS